MLAPAPPITRSRLPVGLALLVGLLILRLPLLAGIATLVQPAPAWLAPVFYSGTFVLNAALIFWERDRLEQFHIDRWALGIYILVPLLLAPVGRLLYLPWVQVACVAVLAAALLLTRTKLPKGDRRGLRWLGIAVPVGIALGVGYGFLLRIQDPILPGRPSTELLQVVPLFLMQLTRAATLEEPLFRGFLWGYLRLAGWKDLWIWLLQAGLFTLGHSYYFGTANVSFWLIVPLGGLVMGWVAWRSRSIGGSMVVHGFGNSLGDLVGHFHW